MASAPTISKLNPRTPTLHAKARARHSTLLSSAAGASTEPPTRANLARIRRYGNVAYVDERHRHRYEVNPDLIMKFEDAGLKFVGKDESGKRMEVGSWRCF